MQSQKGLGFIIALWGNDRIEVVSSQNKEKQWVILSVWSKAVYGNQAKPEPWWKYVLRQILGR